MTRGLSFWLDALRAGAAIVVLLSHIAYERFTRGDYLIIRDLNLGSDAVVVFFVISGLVIAYAAGRDGTGAAFAFNRATRLLSVVLPALLLTWVLDTTGFALRPEAYPAPFYQQLPFWEFLLRGLTFTNEWGAFERVRLGTNGPLWSLSYEALYYALFGAAVFLSGARRVAVIFVLAIVGGPRILLLMPAWLMGVWLWRQIASGRAAGLGRRPALLLALGGPCLYAAALATGVPGALAQLTASAFAPENHRVLLAFSDEFLWNAVIGVLTAAHVLGMARLMEDSRMDMRAIRALAAASFSIYVTHYPVLHAVTAVIPESGPLRDLVLLTAPLVVGLGFAALFELRIAALRAGLLAIAGTGPQGVGRRGLSKDSDAVPMPHRGRAARR